MLVDLPSLFLQSANVNVKMFMRLSKRRSWGRVEERRGAASLWCQLSRVSCNDPHGWRKETKERSRELRGEEEWRKGRSVLPGVRPPHASASLVASNILKFKSLCKKPSFNLWTEKRGRNDTLHLKLYLLTSSTMLYYFKYFYFMQL